MADFNSNVYEFSSVPRVFALSFDPAKGLAVGEVAGGHMSVRRLTTEVVGL